MKWRCKILDVLLDDSDADAAADENDNDYEVDLGDFLSSIDGGSNGLTLSYSCSNPKPG